MSLSRPLLQLEYASNNIILRDLCFHLLPSKINERQLFIEYRSATCMIVLFTVFLTYIHITSHIPEFICLFAHTVYKWSIFLTFELSEYFITQSSDFG